MYRLALRTWGLVGLLGLFSLGQLSAQDKKKYEDPTPRKEAILKRFVAEFVPLTPGQGKFPASFIMGTDEGPATERPAHKVAFTQPLAIAKYEVTQELYHVVMGQNPSRWQGPRNSVEEVDWNDAQTFCQRVTRELRQRKLLDAAEEIRLPSEAEWEYACRAGTTSAYGFGDAEKDLTHYAWYQANSKGYDPPVGAKKANAWGLYDMHGYIWEWCADDWSASYSGTPTDGRPYIRNPQTAARREKVLRGGSWADPADMCRCGYRRHQTAATKDDKIGFRCVRATVANKNIQGGEEK